MTSRFQAVYEHGVLRPIEPVSLEEGTKVEVIVPLASADFNRDESLDLAVSTNEPSGSNVTVMRGCGKGTFASSASNGHRAAVILAEIAALPMQPGGREFAGRDHDKILYGERSTR